MANRYIVLAARSAPMGENHRSAQRKKNAAGYIMNIMSRPRTTLFCACVSSSSSTRRPPSRLITYTGACMMSGKKKNGSRTREEIVSRVRIASVRRRSVIGVRFDGSSVDERGREERTELVRFVDCRRE